MTVCQETKPPHGTVNIKRMPYNWCRLVTGEIANVNRHISFGEMKASDVVFEYLVSLPRSSPDVIRDLALVHHDSSSVAMETGKPGLVSAPVHISSVAAQAEKRMDTQAPLTAVYIHTVPALPVQPYPQPPAAAPEPATLHLAMPPLYSKETLPFLTLHIAGGLQSQPGLSLAAAAPAARPKSAGKHVCSYCGRDCMKPSVLEKHLRCHTGERPYPCTTCGVSFKTQSNLYKHRRTQAHARLSSESEQSSLDSMSSSRETCTSSLSVDERSEESCNMEKDTTTPAAESISPASVKTQGFVSEHCELPLTGHITETTEKIEEKLQVEKEKTYLTVNRHLPLQRQEATLFSKQWENSASRGKSQSHESTDSGFSESSDHYSSPGSVLPDHSMDSLSESSKEHLEETHTPSETGHGGQEPGDTAREQEHKSLEERISKLISDNTAVVEDKQLENVRPRKTVLSKQGSIDLPMPYTYKDSFHFDMRISQSQNSVLQRNRKPGLYTSVPTQHSCTVEHAPLTRSNSLPFSVTLLQPERSSPTSSYQSDYVTLVRRGSAGQLNPTGFAIKPVNQHSSTHRPLVRQTAVDCNHATDGLFTNSSVEEACTGSLSCDGDGGGICGEPSNRKFRRKKTQKFAYNKWYMYGGGTFKKLYNAEKNDDNSVIKGRKCSTNPEHEAVQDLQKRLSGVHKETVTTTSTTINVRHPTCPPAHLSLFSSVDLNPQTAQINPLCSPLKAPLCRNLSLSILPLPSIGSLVSHMSDRGKTETRRLIHEEKHTDSTSQVCGAHIPSDRKKQRTDDKIILETLEMETDLNTQTHPPPSVTSSSPQQDTNLTYVSLQKNPQHSHLKGALFQPFIINANTLSVSTSTASSIPSPAKNSFLPKYQLKLPNTVEPDSSLSPQVMDKPTSTDGRAFTSALAEQTIASVTTREKTGKDPIICNSDVTQTSVFSSSEDQHVLSSTVTTLTQTETSRLSQNSSSSLAVVHRPFAATTITTSCLHDYRPGLCSTLIQPSRPAASSAIMHLPRPVAPVVASLPATLTITTTHNSTSGAAVKVFSQDQPYISPNPPSSHTQVPVSSSGLSNTGNRAPVGPSAPVVPCHVIQFDQVQPAAQNVFHVQTADLQICLQIISDEQLALIEPQIECPSGTIHSQREGIQNKAHSFGTVGSTSVGRDNPQLGHQTKIDKSESLPTIPNPTASVQFGKVETTLHLAEHSNSLQAVSSAESIPPETAGLLLRPHQHSHVTLVTDTESSAGDVMISTAASLGGVKSGMSQISEGEQALSLKHCAEERLLADRRVSQGGIVTLCGQHKLSVSSVSPSTANQNSMKSEKLGTESQHKPKNQGLSCNVGTMKTKDEALAHKRSSLECEECLSQNPEAADTDRLSGSSFSINKCKASRQLEPQASIYCNQMEPTSKHVNVGSSENTVPSLEMTPCKSQHVISKDHTEKQPGQPTSGSSNIQVERPRDISSPAVPAEASSLPGCAAQKEPQTQEHVGTPGQPDWRPKQSQEAAETTPQCLEEQPGGGVMTGEDKNSRINRDKLHGEWSKMESNCRSMALPETTKPEGEDRKVSWVSGQHLQHLSQTHSGMSEYPPQSPQQAPSTSNNIHLPASSIQTSLLNLPQPQQEISHFYIPQENWESSVTHNQQTQLFCDTSRHLKTTQLTEDVFSGAESSLQTFSQQDQSIINVIAGNSRADVGTLSYSSQVSPACRAGLSGSPSKPFTHPEPGDKHDSMDRASNDFMSQRDVTNKYQSFFMTGPLHGYQPAECLTSGLRPVQSCQDNTEDTSSSDDEGKLIIEL
ncbi:zinc finger protein 831 isoform X2 [Parambassis ranga]|uniref:Zinc finger protein 831 isoform X2 n=1 Tax=Parambassis ranga TaxID=210632 RepID=A0A6P7I9V6_9TELE|nr:zinc finger protein 831 isoform X2 [Parambassis ranga]